MYALFYSIILTFLLYCYCSILASSSLLYFPFIHSVILFYSLLLFILSLNSHAASCVLPVFISLHLSALLQVCVGIVTDRSAPQQLVVPHGSDGGSAEGSDAEEQQHTAQTVATTHRVHGGETADQLDVHLPLRLPPGQLLSF